MLTDDKENQVSARETVIKVEGLTKTYDLGYRQVKVLRGIDLEVKNQDFVILYGPSGCGKSTLLHILTGTDNPTDGHVYVRGKDIFQLKEDERGLYRSKKMGIIYQMPYWIKSLNVAENVALPLIIEGVKEKHAIKRAQVLLAELKIDQFAREIPTQLSGGEQQKIGLARALVTDPLIIIADEPTGNLDSSSSDEVMSLFDTLNKELKKTIVLVTHNQAYWEMGTKRVEMQDGVITKEVNCG